MEKKKFNLGESAAEAGKAAAGLFGKAKNAVVSAVDQNDDGRFDLKDVSALAGTIGTATSNAASAIQESAEARKREYDKKIFQPIFAENLDDADFVLPKMIRLTEMDKKRAESDVCQGSIGFYSDFKEMKLVNIFRDKLNVFGLSFYPDTDSEIYYVDPCDRDHYIALEDYFVYLKKMRVSELQWIAESLGAKHFRVSFKEQQEVSSEKKSASHAKKGHGAVNIEQNLESAVSSASKVAAEMDCPGHAPVLPELHYFKRDPEIELLIDLRMKSPLAPLHKEFSISFGSTSGIKEKDAIKIDSVLKSMKLSLGTTVTSEFHHESQRFFEYEIDF